MEIDQSDTVLADCLVAGGGDGGGRQADFVFDRGLLGGCQREFASQALDGGGGPVRMRLGEPEAGASRKRVVRSPTRKPMP